MTEQARGPSAPSVQSLQEEIARLKKINQALMNRAERSASLRGSDFNLFQMTITLEDQVRRRTGELEAAMRENEKITRALREEAMNRAVAEKQLAHEARELAQRTRDMRLVLDNVNEGLLTVSSSGILAMEHSGIIEQWFGAYAPNTRFVDYIGHIDASYAANFSLGYEGLLDDVLPRELCLAQLPVRLYQGIREYRCSYVPLEKNGQLDGLLIIINDITALLLHARHEAERNEMLAMVEAISQDRSGFLSFFDEADELMAQIANANHADQKRALHTLKGNASMVGFGIITSLCHGLENEIQERSDTLPASSLIPLQARWNELSRALLSFLGEKGRDVIELKVQQIAQLEHDLSAGASPARAIDMLASWRLEPTERPLKRLSHYAAALSKRLGKGDVEIDIQPNGVRLDPKIWTGVWADLVHVVRNALDHGIETSETRERANKPSKPHLRLSTRLTGLTLQVEVEDNGSGIDWESVKTAARNQGLPHATEDQLVEAIFSMGLSTRQQVTTVSGRGVGLSAIKQQVKARGGQITLVTQKGQGTCFRFVFPLTTIGPRFGVEQGPLE